MATPETNLNAQANEFAAFSQVEVTAEEKGPSLPDSVTHAVPMKAGQIQEILASLNANDKVKADFASALEGRPAAFLVVTAFPIPRGNEIDRRKARNVYGAASGADLPIADSENNRLKYTALVFAQVKKDEDTGSAATAEKDLDENSGS